MCGQESGGKEQFMNTAERESECAIDADPPQTMLMRARDYLTALGGLVVPLTRKNVRSAGAVTEFQRALRV